MTTTRDEGMCHVALLDLQMLEAPEHEGGVDNTASILEPESGLSLLLC